MHIFRNNSSYSIRRRPYEAVTICPDHAAAVCRAYGRKPHAVVSGKKVNEMRQSKKAGQILIIIILCILILYLGFYIGDFHIKDMFFQQTQMSSFLMSRAEKNCLAGLSYRSDGRASSFSHWVAETAMEFIPLGTYVEEQVPMDTEIEDRATYEMILAKQANDENAVDENGNLIGKEPETKPVQATPDVIDTSLEKLKDFEYLTSHFYTIDSSTSIDAKQLDAEKLLSKNMKLDTSKEGPKVLIYHTHSQEAFQDSRAGETSDTIMGMGAYLAKLLNETYGISTIHHEGVYDLIDGKSDRSKAYQLAEPQIQKILKENPSIEVVIDLHRDGVANTTHLVTEIDGKPTAQIMFFNGLSRTKANGNIAYLSNPYIEDNLAFSLQMQIAASKAWPGFTRHIYLKSYRYNMHLMPKALLIEAGAQTNTVEEMRNAMVLLASTLDSVLMP